MPPILLPQLSRWTAPVVRLLVCAVPAALAGLFAVLILFTGLFLGEERRKYALRAAKCATDFAKALITIPENAGGRAGGGEDQG